MQYDDDLLSSTLADKTLLVIGGSSGFGYEVARLADTQGARIVIAGRDGNKARKVANSLSNGSGHEVDATDDKALKALMEEVGTVDHVVSMVGGAMGGGFLEADPDEIRQTIEGKFFANLHIARTVSPYIQEGGSLVLTAGAGGRPDNASGAIVGNESISLLVRGLGVELAPSVRVNAVAPTWTPTGLWRDLDQQSIDEIKSHFEERIPLGRTARLKEVAQAYLFLMNCGFITGQVLTIDGGLTLVE